MITDGIARIIIIKMHNSAFPLATASMHFVFYGDLLMSVAVVRGFFFDFPVTYGVILLMLCRNFAFSISQYLFSLYCFFVKFDERRIYQSTSCFISPHLGYTYPSWKFMGFRIPLRDSIFFLIMMVFLIFPVVY